MKNRITLESVLKSGYDSFSWPAQIEEHVDKVEAVKIIANAFVALDKVKKVIEVLKDAEDVPTSVVIKLLEGAVKGTVSDEYIKEETDKFKSPIKKRLESI